MSLLAKLEKADPLSPGLGPKVKPKQYTFHAIGLKEYSFRGGKYLLDERRLPIILPLSKNP